VSAKFAVDATVVLVFNAWHEGVSFTLPPAVDGAAWMQLFDTALNVQATSGPHDLCTLTDAR